MRPHITELGPPEGRARLMDAERAVHVLRMAKARPRREILEKLRLSSCLWPSCSRAAESSMWTFLSLGAWDSMVKVCDMEDIEGGTRWERIWGREVYLNVLVSR
jgi:hypothetical protein